MAKTQYLDQTGLVELIAQIKAADAVVKNFAGDITGKTNKDGVAYASVQAYLEDEIAKAQAAATFDGKAASVSIEDTEGLITATNVEGALAEIAKNIDLLEDTDKTKAGTIAKMIADEIGELKIGDTTYSTVKAYVDALIVAVKKIISNEQGTLTDLTTTDKSNLVAAINEVNAAVGAVDFSGKADKVASATAGNFAGLDADGNLTDSGKKASDFDVAGAAAAVSGYAEGETAKTVKEVATAVAGLGTASAADVATVAIGTAEEAENALPTVAQVKAYVEGEVADLEGALHFVGIKEELPAVAESADGDVCVIGTKEYIFANGTWKELGDEGLWVANTRQIAGLALSADITADSLKAALDVDDLETAVGKASTETEEGSGLTKRIENLEDAIGDGGSVADAIQDAIEELDSKVTNAPEAGGEAPEVTVTVTQTDGKLTSVTATVKAETFDAYGAAADVQGDTTETVASVDAKVATLKGLVGDGFEGIPVTTVASVWASTAAKA